MDSDGVWCQIQTALPYFQSLAWVAIKVDRMRVTQASGLEGIDQGIYNLVVRFSERIACKCKCELFDDHGCMYTKACKGELTPSRCYEWWTICACSSPTSSFMPFCIGLAFCQEKVASAGWTWWSKSATKFAWQGIRLILLSLKLVGSSSNRQPRVNTVECRQLQATWQNRGTPFFTLAGGGQAMPHMVECRFLPEIELLQYLNHPHTDSCTCACSVSLQDFTYQMMW